MAQHTPNIQPDPLYIGPAPGHNDSASVETLLNKTIQAGNLFDCNFDKYSVDNFNDSYSSFYPKPEGYDVENETIHSYGVQTLYDKIIKNATISASNIQLINDTVKIAAKATGLATFKESVVDLTTVTIGDTTYRYRSDALGAGVKAACVLDLTANPPLDGDFVTLGLITYTFKTSLTPTAGEIRIEATSAASVANLVAAASGGPGAGEKYATGTSGSPNVLCVAVNNTMTVEYKTIGYLGNSFDTLTGNGVGAMKHGSFHAASLHGGIDAQAANDVLIGASVEDSIHNLAFAIAATAGQETKYGTGTITNTEVIVTAHDGTTITLEAITIGTGGNSIVTESSNVSIVQWDDDTLLLGEDGMVAGIGTMLYDSGFIYIAIDNCTAIESHWAKAALTPMT